MKKKGKMGLPQQFIEGYSPVKLDGYTPPFPQALQWQALICPTCHGTGSVVLNRLCHTCVGLKAVRVDVMSLVVLEPIKVKM